MMKELYMVDNCYRPTSAGTNRMVAFAKNLGKKGIFVTFFFLFPNENRDKCQENFENVSFIYLWDSLKATNKYYCTLRSFFRLWNLLKQDIPVYVYSMINLLYFFRLKKGIRLFAEITECPEFSGRNNGLLGNLSFFLFKKTVKKLDGLFVITPSLQSYFIEDYGIEKEKTCVLNMTVDPDRFSDLNVASPLEIISYCGIMGDKKDGISNLIKSFALVHKKHDNYKLVLMGGFEDNEAQNSLYGLVKSLNLTDHVIFKGIVPSSDMPDHLVKSKILVLARPTPKEKAYGFATKIGEYLMTQRPVVMTNVANVEAYLTDMFDVILSKPNDVNDFADKICWVIENYEIASDIGRHGKETALKLFNSEIETEKIIQKVFD